MSNKHPIDGWAMFKAEFKPHPMAPWHGAPSPYCGKDMAIGTLRAPTKDHVIPRSHGGTLAPDNKLIVCRPCNGDKANLDLESFYEGLAKVGDERAPIVRDLIVARAADPNLSERLAAGSWRAFNMSQMNATRPIPYEDSIFILKNGKKAYREMKAREARERMLSAVPKEYDDPKAQEAFERAYAGREHLLRECE